MTIVKCVIWDLDNTIWTGILLEGGGNKLRAGARRIIQTLDQWGVLQSISSRNEPALALNQLSRHRLDKYFLGSQIGWGEKADGVAHIASVLDVALEHILIVDDDPYERAMLEAAYPHLRTFFSARIEDVLDVPGLRPGVITAEAHRRRQYYSAELRRRNYVQLSPSGHPQNLGLKLTLDIARVSRVPRIQELMVRTRQLNTATAVYSIEELESALASDRTLVVVGEAADRFGSYGLVSMAILQLAQKEWESLALTTSCRVMARGVGSKFIDALARVAISYGARIAIPVVPTQANRVMVASLRFLKYEEISGREGGITFRTPALGDGVATSSEVIVRKSLHLALREKLIRIGASDRPTTGTVRVRTIPKNAVE